MFRSNTYDTRTTVPRSCSIRESNRNTGTHGPISLTGTGRGGDERNSPVLAEKFDSTSKAPTSNVQTTNKMCENVSVVGRK
jgi:hypothetical protein